MLADLGPILRDDIQKMAAVSHWIRTKYEPMKKDPLYRHGYHRYMYLDRALVASIIKNPCPSLPEQADSFVRWIGDNIRAGGEYVNVNQFAIQAVVGSATFDEFQLVFGHLKDAGVITNRAALGGGDPVWCRVTLSFAGWERYRELKRVTSDSHTAFMAMQYDEPPLDNIVSTVFKPAVKQTGFDLFILPDRPKAGLIDDKLRVAIQTSRFLIADLTHENAGAYWEAGYAEGIGRPVIYTCEKQKFEEAKTHFDTNHHLTVRWDAGKPQEVAEELKATIRATLPAEAKLTDD